MDLRAHLLQGHVIPAHPLALTAERQLDERRQCGLTRYYVESGAGGIAVGVHTTQFAIREHGLYEPVLRLGSEAADAALAASPRDFLKVAGICGRTEQAESEAETARALGYHAGLLSLGAWREAPEKDVLAHCRTVAKVIPLFGFYLQPAVGGRIFDVEFWQRLLEIPNLVAIKVAPFNRYQTLDVVRALAESGRDDVALYTGNDDNIVLDLLTEFRVPVRGEERIVRFSGGLLGQWAVGTGRAVDLLKEIQAARGHAQLDPVWLTRAAQLTEVNAAIFDAANGFAGCIPGIHEVLLRQGLLASTWCLDTEERLSPGQAEEIDRVMAAYPEFTAESADDVDERR